MKKLLLPFLFLALVACEKDSANNGPAKGCISGIPINGTERVFMYCGTQEQYMAGNNVNQGGWAQAGNYKKVRWTKSACNKCPELDYSQIP